MQLSNNQPELFRYCLFTVWMLFWILGSVAPMSTPLPDPVVNHTENSDLFHHEIRLEPRILAPAPYELNFNQIDQVLLQLHIDPETTSQPEPSSSNSSSNSSINFDIRHRQHDLETINPDNSSFNLVSTEHSSNIKFVIVLVSLALMILAIVCTCLICFRCVNRSVTDNSNNSAGHSGPGQSAGAEHGSGSGAAVPIVEKKLKKKRRKRIKKKLSKDLFNNSNNSLKLSGGQKIGSCSSLRHGMLGSNSGLRLGSKSSLILGQKSGSGGGVGGATKRQSYKSNSGSKRNSRFNKSNFSGRNNPMPHEIIEESKSKSLMMFKSLMSHL